MQNFKLKGLQFQFHKMASVHCTAWHCVSGGCTQKCARVRVIMPSYLARYVPMPGNDYR